MRHIATDARAQGTRQYSREACSGSEEDDRRRLGGGGDLHGGTVAEQARHVEGAGGDGRAAGVGVGADLEQARRGAGAGREGGEAGVKAGKGGVQVVMASISDSGRLEVQAVGWWADRGASPGRAGWRRRNPPRIPCQTAAISAKNRDGVPEIAVFPERERDQARRAVADFYEPSLVEGKAPQGSGKIVQL